MSHSWGPHGCDMTITATNLHQHMNNISSSDMPQTFQEAVVFTRKLGIRYLWIYALCIIQCDEPDWERESLSMTSVYSRSYLTLSAASVASGDDVLYTCKARDLIRTSLHHREGQPFHRNRFFMRTRMSYDALNALGSINFPVQYTYGRIPLLARACAFQERILAPRVLRFGSKEIY